MKDLIFITMLLLSVPPCFSQQQTNDYVLRYKDIAIKEMQRNWIGKSHGVTLNFEVLNEKDEVIDKIETFTTNIKGIPSGNYKARVS